MQYGPLKIFSGTGNRPLTQEIAECLEVELGQVRIERFADGEIYVRYEENVRGVDAFVVQPLCHPVNENLMELLIMLDAARRASAGRITAVIPYYGYAQKDKKDAPREPITGRLVADMLITAGANRVLTVDLHAGQIEGFFSIPVDHLRAMPLFADYLRHKGLRDAVVVAADAGAVKRSKELADRLNLPLAIIFQRRIGKDQKEPVEIVGTVEGKTPVIGIEDRISTAGTLYNAVDILMAHGARPEVYICATHAAFAGAALERLQREEIREVIVTNTIPPPAGLPEKVTILSVAPLLGEAIRRIHGDQSVSALFT
ncbi:MAG: ribose-phosphate pyrophosphokinase [Armatimonadota bacterium]|nr:ribose-phosphate pyrophosphokinase [Armatimonadota bacterium]MDR5697288.1 ribose-phosphate pyrophosphokinase [Armatimonadota bacterium]